MKKPLNIRAFSCISYQLCRAELTAFLFLPSGEQEQPRLKPGDVLAVRGECKPLQHCLLDLKLVVLEVTDGSNLIPSSDIQAVLFPPLLRSVLSSCQDLKRSQGPPEEKVVGVLESGKRLKKKREKNTSNDLKEFEVRKIISERLRFQKDDLSSLITDMNSWKDSASVARKIMC